MCFMLPLSHCWLQCNDLKFGTPGVPLGHSLEFTRERYHKVPVRDHYYNCYIVSGHIVVHYMKNNMVVSSLAYVCDILIILFCHSPYFIPLG